MPATPPASPFPPPSLFSPLSQSVRAAASAGAPRPASVRTAAAPAAVTAAPTAAANNSEYAMETLTTFLLRVSRREEGTGLSNLARPPSVVLLRAGLPPAKQRSFSPGPNLTLLFFSPSTPPPPPPLPS
jgi:hypothetical protein